MSILKEVRWKKFEKLLYGHPKRKRDEIKKLYANLCEYVHLSEESQTDALRDSDLNLALNYPCYQDDKEMLMKTFDCSLYLLSEGLKKGIVQKHCRFN